MPISVLLVDDNERFRRNVRRYLALDEGITVVGEAEDGEVAVAMARALAPEIVVMDVHMPRMDGFAATRQIRAEIAATVVIILTSGAEGEGASDARNAGASGYLIKDDPAELLRAIKRVASGQTHFQPLSIEADAQETRHHVLPLEQPPLSPESDG